MANKGEQLGARSEANTQNPSREFLHTCQGWAEYLAPDFLSAHTQKRETWSSLNLKDHKANSQGKCNCLLYWNLREISFCVLIEKNLYDVICFLKSLIYILEVNEDASALFLYHTVDGV